VPRTKLRRKNATMDFTEKYVEEIANMLRILLKN
jgi:hypothetical protein